jgi:shikimate kinase
VNRPISDGATGARHVVLIGLMAAGKSTVGRHLAASLGRPLVDSDRVVEKLSGHPPVELERLDGLDRLHDAEIDSLRKVLAGDEPVVFAAAASVVDRATADDLRHAFSVWLDVAPAVLAERIAADHPRPALGDDPLGTLRHQAEGRRPAAKRLVDLWIDAGGLDAPALAEQIAAAYSRSVR